MTNEQIIEIAKLAGFYCEGGEFIRVFPVYEYTANNGPVNDLLTKFAELTKARTIPDGYVLVPIVPTDAILEADWMVTLSDAHTTNGVAYCAYTAMIKAAQQERN